jgi:7-carboxy-7-deazaguanine synthase
MMRYWFTSFKRIGSIWDMSNSAHNAHIVEIFSSLQGEGIYAGQPMTFVRFQRCNMKCAYCDTPQGLCHHEECQVESPPTSGNFTTVPNPVSATALCDILGSFEDDTLSLTGGEPLEQAEFLAAWLPSQVQGKRILLETNGTLHEELKAVLPYTHVVGMDIKLPSSTGCRPRWKDHATFLKAVVASGREVYTKIVITGRTTDRDIQEAIGLISQANKYVPTVIQPASPTLTFHQTVKPSRIKAVERLCRAYLPDVRVLPQLHKKWGVR